MRNLEIIHQLFYDIKLLSIYQSTKLQTGIFMHKAFHMTLPYNMQKHSLFKRTDYEVKKGKFVASNKHMYVLQKSNCVSVTGIKLWNSIENHA